MLDYLQISEGLNQRSLVPITTNIHDLIKQKPNKDWYSGLFKFKDRHYEHYKKNRSVAGIKDVTTDRLLFDFDNSDINIAKNDTIEAVRRLIYDYDVPRDDIRIAFSGNKGFHIELNLNQFLTRQQFVNIVFNVAGDLASFDERINDEARIIRLPLTKHPVSGLHKIPLSTKDLKNLSIDEIKEMAKDVTSFDHSTELNESLHKIDLPVKLSALTTVEYKKVESATDKKEILGFNTDDIDFSLAPKFMAKERYALQEGFFYGTDSVDKGERNSAFLILASTYKNQGFSADHTLSLLEVTANKQSQRTGEDPYSTEQLKREIINAVFSPAWKGGQFSSDEPLLQLTRERFALEDAAPDVNVEGIEDVGEGFKHFTRNIKNNRILTGLPSLDKRLVLTTGMVCTLVAAPGAGKTAFGNLFAETVSKEGNHALYFSLDLFKNLLFTRMIQRYINYDTQVIFSQFEEQKPDEHLVDAYSQVIENYSNVGFSFRSSSVEDIEQELISYIKRKGVAPKLLIIDYLDKVRSPFTDPTQSSAYVVGRLSDMAKKYNTLVLLMAQPSKNGSSGPEQEFKSYRAMKGSSAIESESRVVLGIHRPGYNPADSVHDKYTTITLLKNNAGPLMQLEYAWDGLSGSIKELSTSERGDLMRLKKDLEEKTKKEDEW